MKCFVARWLISGALDGRRELTDGVTRHIAQCATCRRFRTVSQALAEKLGPAAGCDPCVPEHLHMRIMASVRDSGRALSGAGLLPARPALIGGLAVAALLMLLLGISVWPLHRSGLDVHPKPVVLRAIPAADVGRCSRVAASAASEASMAVAMPMADEIEKLRSDIFTVGGHLLACLEQVSF